MSRLARLVAVVAVAGAIVATASATESTIYPGVGIGKVRLGMTQSQVKKALGSGFIISGRATVGGAQYVELAWNFSSWAVDLVKVGGTFKAVQVATTLRAQRRRQDWGLDTSSSDGSGCSARAGAVPAAPATEREADPGAVTTTLRSCTSARRRTSTALRRAISSSRRASRRGPVRGR